MRQYWGIPEPLALPYGIHFNLIRSASAPGECMGEKLSLFLKTDAAGNFPAASVFKGREGENF